jgi:membrane protease YdiL (CAAX protease family)
MLQELDLPAVLATLLIVGALGGSAALWFARLLMPRSAIQQNNPVPPWAIGWVNFGIFICALIVAVYLAQSLSALLLASEATTEDGGAIELTPWLAVVSILLLQLPLLAVFYLSRRYFPHQFAGRLNSEPLPIWTALLRSLPIFLRYLPIIWFVSLIWNGLLKALQEIGWIGATPPQELIELFGAGGDPIAIALLVLFAVALAPAIEEIIFRGCVYRFLKSQTLIPFAQVLSGLLFALLHGNLMSFGPLLVVGILLAHVYETEGNLWVAVSFHALFNSFSLVMLLLINQSGSLIAP